MMLLPAEYLPLVSYELRYVMWDPRYNDAPGYIDSYPDSDLLPRIKFNVIDGKIGIPNEIYAEMLKRGTISDIGMRYLTTEIL